MPSIDAADEDWEWPEDNQVRSSYYIPNRVETSDTPAPPADPSGKLIKTKRQVEAGSSNRVTTIHDYAWNDEGRFIKVYIKLPGVTAANVVCDFGDDKVDMRVENLPTGTHVLALRRMFDRINGAASFFKLNQENRNTTLEYWYLLKSEACKSGNLKKMRA